MHALLQSVPPALRQATSGPRLHRRLPDTHRQVGSLLLSPESWCTRFCCALQACVSQSSVSSGGSGGVNGDLLQEDLCHTHSQSPCLCGRPLLTCTSTGNAQTQFCLSVCGVPGSQCAQGLFEPSEHFWWEWGVILNMNLPLRSSFWGFSFALGREVSPHSCSSAYHLTGVSLTLAGPAKHLQLPQWLSR